MKHGEYRTRFVALLVAGEKGELRWPEVVSRAAMVSLVYARSPDYVSPPQSVLDGCLEAGAKPSPSAPGATIEVADLAALEELAQERARRRGEPSS